MRQVFLGLFILALGCVFPIRTIVQDDDTNTHLFIYAEVNLNSPLPEPLFSEGQSHYGEQFFEALRTRLSDYNVEVTFITLPEFVDDYPDYFESHDKYPDVFLDTTLSFGLLSYLSYEVIRATPFVSYDSSPLPFGDFGYSMMALIVDDASLEIIVDLVAAMSLYIVRDCESALPLLLDADETAIQALFIQGNTRFYAGNCANFLEDYEAAVSYYLDVVDYAYEDQPDIDERNFTAFTATNLAWTYLQIGDTTAALDILNQYQDLTFRFAATPYIQLAIARSDLYLVLQEPELAINEFDLLITQLQNNPDLFITEQENARIYAERGWRYVQLDNPDAALEDYTTAISIDASYPKTYYYRGILYRDIGEIELAISDFEQFLSLAADYQDYLEVDLSPLKEEAEEFLSTQP